MMSLGKSALRPVLHESCKRGMAFLHASSLTPRVSSRAMSSELVDKAARRALVASRTLDSDEGGAILKKGREDGSSPTSIAGRPGFQIESERQLFRRYQTVWERNVRFPSGKLVSFDVLGNERSDFQSVFVFPFNATARTATVLREYSPGMNAVQYSFVAGMFESDKHASLEDAARAELSEEAHLKGGTLVPLCGNLDGISADKYSRNKFHYFLSVDSEKDGMPGDLDVDEWISIEPGQSLAKIREMISSGLFNTPSSLLGMLALDELRRMGYE